MSAEGAALHRLPPSVARLRTWTEPTIAALSASAGKRDRTRASSSSSRAVTEAPMRRPPSGASEMVRSSATAGEVHHPAGLEDPVLELGQEIRSPGHDLGVGPPLGENLKALVDTAGHSKLESSHA